LRAHPKLALQSQLALPLVPFFADTLARAIFDWNKLAWYEIPDPVMLLTTYAFFCLGSMFLVSTDLLPPSDAELKANYEIARRNLLFHSYGCGALAIIFSAARAIDAAYPAVGIYGDHAPVLLIVSLFALAVSFVRIMKFEIHYVSAG
jgi:hypothetical protein